MPLVPEALNATEFWLLVVISFFTSFTTAAIGIGGGAILLAVMAQVVPPVAIIPLHGVVQLGSNVGRASVMFGDIDRKLLAWFSGGSVIGALIGGKLVVNLPVDTLRLLLGGFILYSVWIPQPQRLASSTKTLGAGGLLTTALTMFVGATGPFVMALLRNFKMPPVRLVATMAGCLSVQHTLKAIVFGLLGFAFGPWVPLMALMIAFGFVGTLIGRRILVKVDPKKFSRILSAVLTVLALKLIADAVL